MGTDGEDIVLARELADDGDEGTADFITGEEAITDMAGPELGDSEGGLALPVADGAGHRGIERGGLLAYDLGLAMGVVPQDGVDRTALDGDLWEGETVASRLDDEVPVAIEGGGVLTVEGVDLAATVAYNGGLAVLAMGPVVAVGI